MLPAFRSRLSVFSFCGLMIVLLGMPLICKWVGHPAREQAYAGMPTEAGLIGPHVKEMFHDPTDPDILFLGSSILRGGVDKSTVEQALSAHLGRPAHVRTLALNWQGPDQMYFLLRDYLDNHHVQFIIWDMPFPGTRDFEPHLESFHWARYGEYSDAWQGLSFRWKFAIYGEMVLGSGRELYSHIRANRLSAREIDAPMHSVALGYYGKDFVVEPFSDVPVPSLDQSYQEPPYHSVRVVGKPLPPYGLYFAEKISALIQEKHIHVAFIHVAMDTDKDLDYIPERGNWPEVLHLDGPMIGAPSNLIFPHMSDERYYRFFQDQHLNTNGSALFTASVLPSILKAYDVANSK